MTEIDPNDAAAWYWLGSTADRPRRPDSARRAPSRPRSRSRSSPRPSSCNPYLTPAIYKLAFAYRLARRARQAEGAARPLAEDQPRPTGSPCRARATRRRRSTARWAGTPRSSTRSATDRDRASPAAPPEFEAAQPLDGQARRGRALGQAVRLHGPRAVIGRVRARFGAAVAAFDADGDGKLDLYLASAVVGPKGIRDALLLNKGDGRFEDASASFGLPDDRASLGRRRGRLRRRPPDRPVPHRRRRQPPLRNRDGKAFEDVTSTLKPVGSARRSRSTARWLDLDQDGDLDLYVVNYCAAEHADKAFARRATPPPGLANAVYRNDGQPDADLRPAAQTAGRRWPSAYDDLPATSRAVARPHALAGRRRRSLGGHAASHRRSPLLDLDDDRDLDLVLAADGAPAGRRPQRPARPVPRRCRSRDSTADRPVSGLLVTDFDKDGRADLVAPRSRRAASRPGGTPPSGPPPRRPSSPSSPGRSTPTTGDRRRPSTSTSTPGPTCSACPPAERAGDSSLAWARNEGKRLATATLAARPRTEPGARRARWPSTWSATRCPTSS